MRSPLRRFACAAALSPLAAACVSYDVDEPRADVPAIVALPVSIPLRGAGSSDPNAIALDAYYGSVIAQMQDAVVERDPELLAALLGTHGHDLAPAWARPAIDQFRRVVPVLWFEVHAARNAEVGTVGDLPAIGEAVPIRVRLSGTGGAAIAVPGAADASAPARVLVAVEVVDRDCYGGSSRRAFAEILTVPQTVRLDRGEVLELEFGIPPLQAEGCQRSVRLDCDLLPGSVLLDGEPEPIRRTRLGSRSFELFPLGIESVADNPYTHLRNGLESGDPRHFDNVFLAARRMPAELRDAAVERAIQQVRLGRPDVARVAMAALRELTGVQIPLDDRDGWLAWWQAQR